MPRKSVEPFAVFASTGDGAWAVSMDQRIVFWNKAAERLLGIPDDKALGRQCWRLLAGRNSRGKPICCHRCRVLSRVRQGETVESFDMICRGRDECQVAINVSTLFVSVESDEAPPATDYLVHLFRLTGEAPELPGGLAIHLLGPTTIARSDGSVIQGRLWRRDKVRGLLAMLASHPGRWLSRSRLVETFWAEMPLSSAHHNLHTTVYNLRRCLEPDLRKGPKSTYIRCEQDHYLFEEDDACWLDVQAFETGIRHARAESDPEKAIPTFSSAQDFYRGSFQSELEEHDWPWHQSERLRLHGLYLASLEEVAARHEQVRQGEEAAATYLRILSLDPCHEPASRGLMHWFLGRGDRLSALSHYHDLEENLRRELDISPGQETVLLYESIRSAA